MRIHLLKVWQYEQAFRHYKNLKDNMKSPDVLDFNCENSSASANDFAKSVARISDEDWDHILVACNYMASEKLDADMSADTSMLEMNRANLF